ncbi:uncharacterized protein EI90DRAFT_2915832, partial [Cantharellus anzutake]|uniref:uncharacterized protein n=1 Tax=Cantharellus anzutake TaxID=1750568 RepID=UPI00190577A7
MLTLTTQCLASGAPADLSTGVNGASATHPPHFDQPDVANPAFSATNGALPAPAHQEPVHSPTYTAPTKRFTAVNVNRKFLEKTNSTTSSSTAQSNKPNALGPTPRISTPPQPPTHSKLVTAKLTSAGHSSQVATGWNKASGLAAPTPQFPNGGATSDPATTQIVTATSKNGLLPPGGTAISLPKSSKNGSGTSKVWGNASQSTRTTMSTPAASDFPTAAEASSNRKSKLAHQPSLAVQVTHTPPLASSIQQAEASADAFRGLHLDPNAHHWDEVYEDGDDFLAEVIEFGDGTQYTIK